MIKKSVLSLLMASSNALVLTNLEQSCYCVDFTTSPTCCVPHGVGPLEAVKVTKHPYHDVKIPADKPVVIVHKKIKPHLPAVQGEFKITP